MFPADTLSRVHSVEVHNCELATSLEELDQTMSLAISDDHLKQIKQASLDDPILVNFVPSNLQRLAIQEDRIT